MSTTYGEPRGLVPAGEARARVSWSAILAGVILAIAIQVLFSILGAGVGLGFVNPGHSDSASASSLGIGVGIWWMLSTILSLLAGSYVAARLAGVGTRLDGVLHGLVVWGLALLLTIYLITTAAGSLLGGAFTVVTHTVSAAGSAIGSTASAVGSSVKSAAPEMGRMSGVTPDFLQQQVQQLLQSPTPQDPISMNAEQATKAVAQQMPALVAGGQKTSDASRRITDIIAAQAHISPQAAKQRVDDAIDQFNQDKQQAIQAAKDAADTSAAAASHVSFMAFIGVLIGMFAGVAGGAIASPREVVVGARQFR